jgi:hypothetical protein
VKDIAAKLARRIERLDNHLAIVLAIHLFVEFLLDRLIEKRSPVAKLVLGDHRTYSFSVKLTLVFHIGVLPHELFDNLRRLNSLRNLYAHEIDVDLASRLDTGFLDRGGSSVFSDPGQLREEIRNDERRGVEALLGIRDVTFGWLHELAVQNDAID